MGGNVASLKAGQRFRRGQGQRGLVRCYPGRLQDKLSMPPCYRAVEPRRINLSQEQAERERVAEGKLADLAGGDIGVQEVAVPDRALRKPRSRRWKRLPLFPHLRAVKR